ncbi:hypothetical protein OsI_02203 [Oryza sativa Indica Group]|uniref:Aminotransferase-like plant mobile domain-containing protein n=1 Tax=Oryza sativa subsp. indica TaxID=39946 RepID=B8A994_ORYSI|nr:hypothetical protein OsI_02203 [Oryza sativa Indica Group]
MVGYQMEQRRIPFVSMERKYAHKVAYWKFIQTLDKDQLQAIDDLGFGGLTKMNGVQIHRILCKQIAREYDEHTGAFNINGTMHEITIEDVDHILGVPSEGVELVEVPQAIQADVDDPKEKEKNEALQATKAALFALYKDKRETKITLSALRDSLNLNKSCDDHFKRQFVLYTIGLILCPTTERFVHLDYLNLLINIADIKRTNWASLTLNHLKRSIVSFQHDKVNLKGNQILLLIVNDIKLPIEATKEYTAKDHSGTDANQPSNMDNTKAQTTDMVDVQLQLKSMNEHLIILRKEIQEFTCTEEDEFLIDYINTSPPDRVLIIDTYIMYLEHKYLEESQARRRVYMMKTFITGLSFYRSSCGLFMLKCMEHWNGSKLTTKFKQGDVDIFRRKLAAILVGSTSNDNTDIPTYNK